jgi:hypothetical protein
MQVLVVINLASGGFFVGQGDNRAYIDGKVVWFDHCLADTWSSLLIDDFISQLGYQKNNNLKIYCCCQGGLLRMV